jgi:hypothetical protein
VTVTTIEKLLAADLAHLLVMVLGGIVAIGVLYAWSAVKRRRERNVPETPCCSPELTARHQEQLNGLRKGFDQGNVRFAGLETDMRELRRTVGQNAEAVRAMALAHAQMQPQLKDLSTKVELSLDMLTATMHAVPEARARFRLIRNGGKTKEVTQRIREIEPDAGS